MGAPVSDWFCLRPLGPIRRARRGRVAIVDSDKPTHERGTPPDLLRCELGYRQIHFAPLAPAGGCLAVFVAPAALSAPEVIRLCRR